MYRISNYVQILSLKFNFMKQANYLAPLLFLTIFFSCNENEKLEGLPTSTQQKTETQYIDSTAKEQNALPASMQTKMPATAIQPNPTAAPQHIVQPEIASSTNPPHGQPGHVCGTPVPNTGTPAKPSASTTAPQMISSPSQIPTAKQVAMPTPVATKPGMNPPHGQAGHRCDISVGEPLSSKPKPAAPATITTPQNVTQQVVEAATNNSAIVNPVPITNNTTPTATTTANKGKPNPAHGQPGHDCKVGVGKPLP